MVFINDGDGRVAQRFGQGCSARVDGGGKDLDDEKQHGGVAQEAPEFFDAQAVDVAKVLPEGRCLPLCVRLCMVRLWGVRWVVHVFQASCFLSRAMAAPMMAGMASSMGQMLPSKSPSPSPLLNTPRLTTIM